MGRFKIANQEHENCHFPLVAHKFNILYDLCQLRSVKGIRNVNCLRNPETFIELIYSGHQRWHHGEAWPRHSHILNFLVCSTAHHKRNQILLLVSCDF